jgi:hypothetical protein
VSEYQEAPRHIRVPVPSAMIDGWTGPVDLWVPPGQFSFSGHWAPVALVGGKLSAYYDGQQRDVRLDPMRPEVRDHLIRALNLPDWMRDRADGIEPWISAGLVACAVAGVSPKYLRNPRGHSLRGFAPDADPGHDAVLLDVGTLLLPWPGGPRIWRKP